MRSIILAATVSAIALSATAQAGGFYVGLSAGHEFGTVDGTASNAAGLFPKATLTGRTSAKPATTPAAVSTTSK
jgi:hypothetical protein